MRRAAGNADTTPSLRRLTTDGDDLLIVDKSGGLATFCHHPEFVDFAKSLVERVAFRPSDRKEPAVSDKVADFKGAFRVDTKAVKIGVVLCPKNQSTGHHWITRRRRDLDRDISILENIGLI